MHTETIVIQITIYQSEISASLGNVEIGKTNEIYIDAKTTLGRTKVNNNYQKSDVTLTIKNQSGDIEWIIKIADR